MAKKIYKKGNYIFIEDTVSNVVIEGAAKDVKISTLNTTSTKFYIKGTNADSALSDGIELADFVDENDVAFASRTAFVDWYTDNTSFSNGGGNGNGVTQNLQEGYYVIPENFDFTSIPVGYDNSTWEIRYTHDLGGSNITIPSNVVLKFNGGKLINYGEITGNGTIIKADLIEIFDNSGDFSGTFNLERVNVSWFGLSSSLLDNTTAFMQSIKLSMGNTPIYMPSGEFNFPTLRSEQITKDLIVRGAGKYKTIINGQKDNSGDCGFFIGETCDNIDVRDLGFKNSTHAIYKGQFLTQSLNSITVDNCSFDDIGKSAIELQIAVNKARITNNYINDVNGDDNSDAYGILLGDENISGENVQRDYWIENNIIKNVIVDGTNTNCKAILCYGRNIRIIGNHIENVWMTSDNDGANAIYTKSRFSYISKNTIHNSGTTASINTKGVDKDAVTGFKGHTNYIEDNIITFDVDYAYSSWGIASFVKESFISGNYIELAPNDAIHLEAGGSGVIDNNYLLNCGGAATDNLTWLRAGASNDVTENMRITNNTFVLENDLDTSNERSHRIIRLTNNFTNLVIKDNVMNLDTNVYQARSIIEFGSGSSSSSGVYIGDNIINLDGTGEGRGIFTFGSNTDNLTIVNNKVNGALIADIQDFSTTPINLKIYNNGGVKPQEYVFADLPTDETVLVAIITDASAVLYRAVATGGGSDRALVFYDGTNWVYS